jgi:catechol 2,3-dioxygenase
VVAPGDESSLVTAAWRTSSDEALEGPRRPRGRRHRGRGSTATPSAAPTVTFPWVTLTLHRDVERVHVTEGDSASIYPDRPKTAAASAGALRQLDHVTIATSDVDAFAARCCEVLGFR